MICRELCFVRFLICLFFGVNNTFLSFLVKIWIQDPLGWYFYGLYESNRENNTTNGIFPPPNMQKWAITLNIGLICWNLWNFPKSKMAATWYYLTLYWAIGLSSIRARRNYTRKYHRPLGAICSLVRFQAREYLIYESHASLSSLGNWAVA